MKSFNLNEYREQLKKSENINDCKKVPISDIDGNDRNYVFISYSTRDYKKVFSDLANFYDKGIRFWYDAKGIPANDNWKAAVRKYLEDPKCSGVIFYLSTNFFESENACLEAELAHEMGKNVFSVNLSTEKSIVNIILEAAKSFDEDEKLTKADELQKIFPKDNNYLTFETVEHDEEIIKAIEDKFDVTTSITLSNLEIVYDDLFFNTVNYFVQKNPIGLKPSKYNLKSELLSDSPLSKVYNNGDQDRIVYSLLNQLQRLKIIRLNDNDEFVFLFDIYKWNSFKYETFEKNRCALSNEKSFKTYNNNFINRMFSDDNLIAFNNSHIYKNKLLKGCKVLSNEYGIGIIEKFDINGLVEIEYKNANIRKKYDSKTALQATYKAPFVICYGDYCMSKLEVLKSFNPKLEYERDGNCYYTFKFQDQEHYSTIVEDAFYVSKNGKIKPTESCTSNFHPCLKNSECILCFDVKKIRDFYEYVGPLGEWPVYESVILSIDVLNMTDGKTEHRLYYNNSDGSTNNKKTIFVLFEDGDHKVDCIYYNSGDYSDVFYECNLDYSTNSGSFLTIYKNGQAEIAEPKRSSVKLSTVYGAVLISNSLQWVKSELDDQLMVCLGGDKNCGNIGVYYANVEKIVEEINIILDQNKYSKSAEVSKKLTALIYTYLFCLCSIYHNKDIRQYFFIEEEFCCSLIESFTNGIVSIDICEQKEYVFETILDTFFMLLELNNNFSKNNKELIASVLIATEQMYSKQGKIEKVKALLRWKDKVLR